MLHNEFINSDTSIEPFSSVIMKVLFFIFLYLV